MQGCRKRFFRWERKVFTPSPFQGKPPCCPCCPEGAADAAGTGECRDAESDSFGGKERFSPHPPFKGSRLAALAARRGRRMRRGRGNAGMQKAILSVGKKGFHPIPLSREAALLPLLPRGGGGCGGDGECRDAESDSFGGKEKFSPHPPFKGSRLVALAAQRGRRTRRGRGMQGYTKRLVERCLFDMVLDMKMQFARMRIAFSAFLDKKEGARRELKDHFWTF